MSEKEMLKALLLGRLLASDGHRNSVNAEDLLEEGLGEEDRRDAAAALDELEAAGLVTQTKVLSGDALVQLTDSGAVYVNDVEARRENKGARRRGCRIGLTLWLRETTSVSRGQDVQGFVLSPLARFAGDIYTVDEILEAATYPYDKNLIRTGHTGFGHGGKFLDTMLSDRGIDCADDFGGDVSEYLNHANGVVGVGGVSVNGTGNIVQLQQHSPGAHQHAAPAQAFSEIHSWADQVEQALPQTGLAQADLDEIRDQLTELRAELTQPAPSPSRLKALGRAVRRVLSDAKNAAAVASAIAAAAHLFT
jgi:hypothetical protein